MAIKSILISQPAPETEKNPYADLSKRFKLKVDFRPFIHVEGVDSKEIRKDKVSLPEHTAVILTSRNAVDHFFRVCKDIRYTVPDTMKYFCISESTAYYLQKYVVYRKRKIFHGKQKFIELLDVIKKHKEENFLLPCSDIHKQEITDVLDQHNIKYTKSVMYKTVASDLSDLADIKYDMLVFFSPQGIESLLQNFPKFKQNKTLIAAFGATTAAAVKTAGLRLDLQAPMPNAPSMTMAIEHFIKNHKEK
ncbi:MAG TPA: uroporphyrinogen-III synthase [Flavobacteriales bacterium]|nr:uroporphyrinogen-III synthase [Flavobacteriales bacterium]HRE74903.1 uroporphyrinogen-III synthase [Flavobacteriales bacterium]HRJ35494.1 uroporphyrinogen-III synthase [Flavobacteriales bacterium]HRJ37487.1 uroporphyrinogen-III synthase [Flavobacteriales bacterium]